jgi:hypothetical protein
MRIVAFSTAVFLTLVAATAPGRRHSVLPPQPQVTALDARRSFVITDTALLQGFTFQRVLNQLVARGGVPNLTTAQLYRQWFDTQNAKPGMADPSGPHCDDFTTNGSPSFNSFPRRCPTFEGALAASPFTSTEYFPIALVNRFDQAPADGSNCGQFRFPRSVDGIQHVADNSQEPGELGQPRYVISSAMSDVFIPHRMKILMDFLNSGKAPVHSQ